MQDFCKKNNRAPCGLRNKIRQICKICGRLYKKSAEALFLLLVAEDGSHEVAELADTFHCDPVLRHGWDGIII